MTNKQYTYNKKNNNGKKAKRIRRNRSAYNFFFKHQRSVILQELSHKNKNGNSHKNVTQANMFSIKYDENTYELLRSTLLNGSDGIDKPKRKHRKTHGMINLKDLTGQIAQRWRKVNPEIKQIYQKLANEDSLRYRNEIRTASISGNARAGDSSSKGRVIDTDVLGTKEKDSNENQHDNVNVNKNIDLDQSQGGKEVKDFSISANETASISRGTLGSDKDLSFHSGNMYTMPRPIEDMILHHDNGEYLSINDFGYFMRILSRSM